MRIGNEEKRKVRDNFLVRLDLEEIFNIENHAYTSEGVSSRF